MPDSFHRENDAKLNSFLIDHEKSLRSLVACPEYIKNQGRTSAPTPSAPALPSPRRIWEENLNLNEAYHENPDGPIDVEFYPMKSALRNLA